jgi:membrane-associated PAP2 superfamily phosphatase
MNSRTLTASFLITHLYIPLALFLGAALLLEFTAVDLWLADKIYQASGETWAWRDHWLTAQVIHAGGRKLVACLLLVLIAGIVLAYCREEAKRYRSGLWYVLGAALLSGLLINLLKELTHIDCPWDLQRYGGLVLYVKNFAPHPGTFEYGACFPAGHASAGYAWLGLYYFARQHCYSWRWTILTLVLSMGLVFGVGQQLRGAHFLSHDLWSLAISWVIASVLQFLLPRDARTMCR